MNVSKTKELVWDYRKATTLKDPVVINNLQVERTSINKYLGLLVDDKFTFVQHVENQIKKANKRLYCVRAMKKLNVSHGIIAMFYNSTIPSVLMYACSAFYGMLTKYLKSEFDRPMRICNRLNNDGNNISCILSDNATLYRERCIKLAGRITKDPGHPLNKEFTLLPSGRWSSAIYMQK